MIKPDTKEKRESIRRGRKRRKRMGKEYDTKININNKQK